MYGSLSDPLSELKLYFRKNFIEKILELGKSRRNSEKKWMDIGRKFEKKIVELRKILKKF